MKIILTYISGSRAGTKREFTTPSVRLGRDPKECDVVFNSQQDPGVSRVHAEISLAQGVFYLQDLGSRNGTFLNDQPIVGRVILPSEAMIQLGLEGPKMQVETTPEGVHQSFKTRPVPIVKLPVLPPPPTLTTNCSQCGAPSTAPARFCRRCGTPLEGSKEYRINVNGNPEVTLPPSAPEFQKAREREEIRAKVMQQQPLSEKEAKERRAQIIKEATESAVRAAEMARQAALANLTISQCNSCGSKFKGSPRFCSTCGSVLKATQLPSASGPLGPVPSPPIPSLPPGDNSREKSATAKLSPPLVAPSLASPSASLPIAVSPPIVPVPNADNLVSYPSERNRENNTDDSLSSLLKLPDVISAIESVNQMEIFDSTAMEALDVLAVPAPQAAPPAKVTNSVKKSDKIALPIITPSGPAPDRALPPGHALLLSAQALYKKGLLNQAVEECERALQLDSQIADAHNFLGLLQLYKGDNDQAITCFQNALRLSPNWVEAAQNLGQAYLRARRYAEALHTVREVVKFSPSAEGYYLFGQALTETGDYTAALDAFSQATKLRSDYAEAYLGIASVQFCVGQYDETIKYCLQAIGTRDNFAQAYCLLGQSYRIKGQYPEAIKVLQAAVKYKPDYTIAYVYLALNYRSENLVQEAYWACNAALDLDPQFPEAHNTLGLLYCDAKQYTEGIAEYEKALVIRPTYAEAHNNLGLCYFKTNDLARAIQCFEQAIAIEQKFSLAHFNLALCYYKKRDPNGVKQQYDRLAELDPIRAQKLYQKVKSIFPAGKP
jgi:tetratricopeptide (TPR) repeat protein/uncharacterized OB-fold protein